jgi:Gpi18-like mannosyltransferase
MPQNKIRFAWLFLLFNPFTLLTTAAWGEYDTLIALLCLGSLYLLSKGMQKRGTLLLSLSVVLKPISVPLLGLPLVSADRSIKKAMIYLLIVAAVIISLWFLPFFLLNWAIPDTPNLATSYFRMAGGMTLFNAVEIFQQSATVPVGFEFLGYIWIVALLIGYYLVYRHPPKTTEGLVEAAVGLLLIFFLTRTWLSEPNFNLLFPLILILYGFGKVSKHTLHMLWIIPFIFLFFNYAAQQLFFLVDPTVIAAIANFDLQWGTWRVLARFGVTLLWFVFALKIESSLLTKKNSLTSTSY